MITYVGEKKLSSEILNKRIKFLVKASNLRYDAKKLLMRQNSSFVILLIPLCSNATMRQPVSRSKVDSLCTI
jgi:hypothetical protein